MSYRLLYFVNELFVKKLLTYLYIIELYLYYDFYSVSFSD